MVTHNNYVCHTYFIMRNIIKANKEYIFTHTEEKTVEKALNFR